MYDDLIKQLRETPSRSKRGLLDEAADRIEELEQDIYDLLHPHKIEEEPVLFCFNEETQMFEELKEPFATIECQTKEDFDRFHELIELGDKMRWISVKDRLPDSFKPVIVCREKAKGEFIVEQGHRDVNGWWKVYGTRTKNVSYWMPLPEPPKEQIDEIILKQDEMLKHRDALKGKKEG